MQITSATGLSSEADSFSEFFGLLVGNARGVEKNKPAAALLEFVKLGVTRIGPIVIPKIKNDRVGILPLLRARPFPGSGDFEAGRFFEFLQPIRLPRRIIMLIETVILLAC